LFLCGIFLQVAGTEDVEAPFGFCLLTDDHLVETGFNCSTGNTLSSALYLFSKSNYQIHRRFKKSKKIKPNFPKSVNLRI
jgi:hypothetical protein